MAIVLFETVAREWFARWRQECVEHYAAESWRRFEREILPVLGHVPIRRVTAPMILRMLRRMESRGVRVPARKARSHVSQIMRYGIACGYVDRDPARDLAYALSPHRSEPRAALLDQRAIGGLMRDISLYPWRQRCHAMTLAVLLFVRSGELAQAEWTEISWDDALWRIPAAKMKMRRPHDVPLARQALDALRAQRRISGQCRWVFPSRRDKNRHEQGRCLTSCLRRMGYAPGELTAHGFRAMAATTLSEMGWPSEVIERQLAHADRNRVRAAYQRSELLEERRRMMQAWADWLDLRHAWAILGR